MRGAVKEDGQWVESDVPEEPYAAARWLYDHDGQDAVAIRDGVRYCGSEALLAEYRDQGKEAGMFFDLWKILEREVDGK